MTSTRPVALPALPAWFVGSAAEYAGLSALMREMCEVEGRRRRRLIGRSMLRAAGLCLAMTGIRTMAFADDGALATTPWSAVATLGLACAVVAVVELMCFLEDHLAGLNRHARFAAIAGPVTARGDFHAAHLPKDAAERRLHAELTRFVRAAATRRRLVPALCRAGFTAAPEAKG